MANIYVFFDGGTWEGYGSGVEVVKESFVTPAPGGAVTLAELERSTALAMTGAASGKLTFKAFKANPSVYSPNLFINLVGYINPPRQALAIFSGQAGKEFIMRLKLRTPSSNPIGSADLNLRLAPMVAAFASQITVPISPISMTKKNVAQITDAWQELEYRFIVQDNNAFYISLVADDSTLRPEDLHPGIAWDFAGTLNVDGELFFDDITVNEVVVCDLAYGAPSFTKTDETAADAEDGTITVNATSSFTREYSLDNVTWQLSNIFTGLAPGTYSVYVRDSNGCTLAPITGISILEFVPPSCDLVISSIIVVNETAPGANDGSATINATSSAPSRLFSIDGVNFQASNVFSPLAPDDYVAYVKNNDGSCQVFQPFTILAAGAPPAAGPLVINQVPINKYNFITWHAASGQANFNRLEFINCIWDLPNAYLLNKIKRSHYPVVCNNERFSFYINFWADYSYGNFSSLRLDLVNRYGMVQQNVAPLQRVFQADNQKYFIYADVTLTNQTPGIYRLVITDTSTPAPYDVLFASQEIQLMQVNDAFLITARFRFRASADIYRYLYTKIPDFIQQIRLRVNFFEEELDGEVTQYRAVSSGKLRNTAFDLDKVVRMETYYFDKLAHRAMFVFQAHDVIIINDMTYLPKDLYRVTWDAENNVHKGTMDLYEQEFSAINRFGDPNAFIVTDPVLGGDDGNVIGT